MGEEGADGGPLSKATATSSRRLALVVVAGALLLALGALLFWPADDDADDALAEGPSTGAVDADPLAAEDDPPADDPSPSATGGRKVFLEVTDERGAPLGGAKVTLLTLGKREAAGPSGADGVVELVVERPTPVEVTASGFATQVFPPPAFGDAPEVFWSVKLKREGEVALLTGFVHADNEPVKNAAVVLLGPSPATSHIVTSRADGRFEFKNPPPEATTIAAVSSTHGEVVQARPAGATEVALALPPPAFVEGTVTDGKGAPVQGVTVRLVPRHQAAKDKRLNDLALALLRDKARRPQGMMLRAGVSQVETRVEVLDGTFRAGPVAANRVDVIGFAPGLSPDRVEDIALSAGSTFKGVKLVLTGAARVSGIVTDSATGKPIKNAQVTTSGSMRAPGFGTARTQADGTFSLAVAPDVRQRLRVAARGYMPYEVGGLTVAADETLEKEIALSKGGKRGPHQQREYVGIGATVKKVDDGVRIEKTIEGGAARDQLQQGDIIMRVDSTWVDDMALQDAIELLVGEEDTEVEVLVKRLGADGQPEELNVVLTRARLQYSTN